MIIHPLPAIPFGTLPQTALSALARLTKHLTVTKPNPHLETQQLRSSSTVGCTPKWTNNLYVSHSTSVGTKAPHRFNHTPPKECTDAPVVSAPMVPTTVPDPNDCCPSPLCPAAFQQFLNLCNASHQFPSLVDYLTTSFPIGDSMPNSRVISITQKNYLKSSLDVNYACKHFLDEVTQHRMIGPLSENEVYACLRSHFRMSPVGLVPKASKPGAFHVIRDLSHIGDAGWSINHCIDHD